MWCCEMQDCCRLWYRLWWRCWDYRRWRLKRRCWYIPGVHLIWNNVLYGVLVIHESVSWWAWELRIVGLMRPGGPELWCPVNLGRGLVVSVSGRLSLLWSLGFARTCMRHTWICCNVDVQHVDLFYEDWSGLKFCNVTWRFFTEYWSEFLLMGPGLLLFLKIKSPGN